jgi:hypothetical protein
MGESMKNEGGPVGSCWEVRVMEEREESGSAGGKRELRVKVGRYWELKGKGGCEFFLGV